ncbi:DUF3718 domain-containing protein [Thalassotalea ponticola]|uniref:DUF3718 domain-containing protein n=1 Tax=Thalassotalea ponticola TaxID=1523392 RepID=UPI0025B354ED|nr:DUF3718 domain-containing protein [Thalassotalea ponticola]MDN3652789.1 DUF3718 domain-containing protein [Thalassotalea ponticola]
MRATIPISTLLCGSLLCFNTIADTPSFVAGDDSLATKLCVSAVTDNLKATKSQIKRLYRDISAQSQVQTHLAIQNISCNDATLVEFTAQYDANDTFRYLNNKARSKYRIDDVDIIDLTHASDRASDRGVTIVVTAN